MQGTVGCLCSARYVTEPALTYTLHRRLVAQEYMPACAPGGAGARTWGVVVGECTGPPPLSVAVLRIAPQGLSGDSLALRGMPAPLVLSGAFEPGASVRASQAGLVQQTCLSMIAEMGEQSARVALRT